MNFKKVKLFLVAFAIVFSSINPSNAAQTNIAAVKSLMRKIEREENMPRNILVAIATVESAWKPWAVYAKRKSHFFKTKAQALSFIAKLRKQGVRNINVGFMQINLRDHINEFKSISAALEPEQNIRFAVKLLKWLKTRLGSWQMAVRYYNTSHDKYNIKYWNKVSKQWVKYCKQDGVAFPAKLKLVNSKKIKHNPVRWKAFKAKYAAGKTTETVSACRKVANTDGNVKFLDSDKKDIKSSKKTA